jgi:iron complex transport system substrate-binding protein
VSYPIVETAARRLDASTQLVSLEPESLDDVLQNIRLIGRLAGRASEAEGVVAGLTARLAAVRRLVAGRERRRVIALEWIDPPFRSGHWTPGLVGLAGGVDLLGRPGERALAIDWRDIDEAEADVVLVMACGFTLERSLVEVQPLAARLAGRDCFVLDGNAFFSRPGPRLVDSVEILAGILHPDAVEPPPVTAARRLN